MKKIMQVVSTLTTGGAETLVKNYALNFNKKKFDVVILSFGHVKGTPYESLLKKNGIRVVYADEHSPFKNHFGVIARAFNYFYRYVTVRMIIKRENPDIIHIHMPVNARIKFARPNRNVTMFYTVHNEPKSIWFSGKFGRKRDFKAAKWLVKHYGMRFIVLHETMKKEVDRLFGVNDSRVLNNGVDVTLYRNDNKETMRKKLGIPEDAFVVGHIGRFAVVKNHGFLVDVFNKIGRNNKYLLLVGDGPEKLKIIKKIHNEGLEDCCLILSNRSDIPDILSAMDVFVFPSLYEGLPVSLIEAQESNLPCFVSDKVSQHAFISNLITALPIEAGAAKWSGSIMQYKKPRKIVVDDSEWDIKKITKKLEQIYMDGLQEKG